MGGIDKAALMCPSCGTYIEVQSKTGPANGRKFKQRAHSLPPHIPIDIASGMIGKKVECPECGLNLVCTVPGQSNPSIQLQWERAAEEPGPTDDEEVEDDNGGSAYGAES
jgi:predicted RNA-binding Zn-ribbon protein involved in translation (DUF1610 family)